MPNQGNTPAGLAVQIDQLIGLLTGLGCSAAVLGEVQEAVKAKAKPRVVPAAEHTVFVLNDKTSGTGRRHIGSFFKRPLRGNNGSTNRQLSVLLIKL